MATEAQPGELILHAFRGKGPGMTQRLRGSTAATVAGALVVAGVLGFALAGHRDDFAQALRGAPIWVLLAATALQLLALLSRCEAWYTCVSAAGGVISRRRLFHAGGLGNLGSLLNAQVGAAARIGILRRSGRDEVPHIPALIASEVPIIAIEAALAVLSSYTLVGPARPAVVVAARRLRTRGGRRARAAQARGQGPRGMGGARGPARPRRPPPRDRVRAARGVRADLRNWLVLRALGVDASIFDATAVLIAMVALSQLPIGPSVGAAAVVMILGAGGVALTAAAGVLLTATGIAGALSFAAWAGIDVLARPRERARRRAVRVRGRSGRPRLAQTGSQARRCQTHRRERRAAELQRRVPRAPGPDRGGAAPRRVLPQQPQALAVHPRRDRRRHRRGDRAAPRPRLAARALQRRAAGLARVRRPARARLVRVVRARVPRRLLRPHELAHQHRDRAVRAGRQLAAVGRRRGRPRARRLDPAPRWPPGDLHRAAHRRVLPAHEPRQRQLPRHRRHRAGHRPPQRRARLPARPRACARSPSR